MRALVGRSSGSPSTRRPGRSDRPPAAGASRGARSHWHPRTGFEKLTPGAAIPEPRTLIGCSCGERRAPGTRARQSPPPHPHRVLSLGNPDGEIAAPGRRFASAPYRARRREPGATGTQVLGTAAASHPHPTGRSGEGTGELAPGAPRLSPGTPSHPRPRAGARRGHGAAGIRSARVSEASLAPRRRDAGRGGLAPEDWHPRTGGGSQEWRRGVTALSQGAVGPSA